MAGRAYLDCNSTTSLHPEVVDAMIPLLAEFHGNPSSGHWFGRTVRAKLEEAREEVAALIGASPTEIYFCSGGTESDNMAIRGAAWNHPNDGSWQVITSAVEHSAVLNTARALSRIGYGLRVVGVDGYGLVDPEELESLLGSNTAVVSVMHSNNEVGTIEPVGEIAERVRARGILMHTDAVQSVGKVTVDVGKLGVDLLSFSAHKIHGPKGVGALYIRKGVRLQPLITGGGHERGLRGGTENVVGIVGFGKACSLARKNFEGGVKKMKALRDKLQARILESIPGTRINGHPDQRLPNTLNLCFDRVEGDLLMIRSDLEGIALSAGSACSSGSREPSHVLTAMRVPEEMVNGAVRISLDLNSTENDVDRCAEKLPEIVSAIRAA